LEAHIILFPWPITVAGLMREEGSDQAILQAVIRPELFIRSSQSKLSPAAGGGSPYFR
jgi:hypothetical protein